MTDNKQDIVTGEVKVVYADGNPLTPRPEFDGTVIWLGCGGVRPAEMLDHDIYEGPDFPAGYFNGIEWRTGQKPEYGVKHVRAEIVDGLREENSRFRAQIARLRGALGQYVGTCEWQTPNPHCDRIMNGTCCQTALAALNEKGPGD